MWSLVVPCRLGWVVRGAKDWLSSECRSLNSRSTLLDYMYGP